MKFTHLVFAILLIVSCSSGKRKTIPRDDMVDILKEIHITEAIFSVTRIRDSKFGEYDSLDIYDSIVISHGYTPAMYDSTIKYYSYHIEEFEKLYDEVIEELNRLEGEVLDSIKSRNNPM